MRDITAATTPDSFALTRTEPLNAGACTHKSFPSAADGGGHSSIFRGTTPLSIAAGGGGTQTAGGAGTALAGNNDGGTLGWPPHSH